MPAGIAAYARTQTGGLCGHSVEAESLLKGARLLDEARANRADTARLTEALDYNFRVWRLLQADVSRPASQLPEGVRSDLLALGRFMNREIDRATRRPEAAAFGAMISINRKLAEGLL